MAKLLNAPHGTQIPLITSVERKAIVVRKAGITSQIVNTAGTYTMRFWAFCYKQEDNNNNKNNDKNSHY